MSVFSPQINNVPNIYTKVHILWQDPSIHFLQGCRCCWSLSQLSWRKSELSPWRTSLCWSTLSQNNIGRQTTAHFHTYSQFLSCRCAKMCGMAEYLERNYTCKGRTCKLSSTQNAPKSRLSLLLWGNNANHCTAILKTMAWLKAYFHTRAWKLAALFNGLQLSCKWVSCIIKVNIIYYISYYSLLLTN